MKIKNLTLIALFAALSCAAALIKTPPGLFVVPITLQSFVAMLAGAVLGARRGAAAQLIYVALGIAGIPVFASGGGFMYVMNPGFGYLLGGALCAAVVGLLIKRRGKAGFFKTWLASAAGAVVCLAFGAAYMYFILLASAKAQGFEAVIWGGILIFLPGELLKSLLVALITPRIKKAARL